MKEQIKAVRSEIQDRLFKEQDLKYKEFHKGIVPGMDPDKLIGVRMPQIRALAKALWKEGKAEAFLEDLPHQYFDENTLHSMLLGLEKDMEKAVACVNAFLPYVDNWAVCDGLSPAAFKKHHAELLALIPGWLASPEPYTIRFGIEMLMSHFLDDDFTPETAAMVEVIRSEEYYVNMMIAWYFATALAKQWDAVIYVLTEKKLDKWTHNKTIQKAVESYRITEEQKKYLKTLRRKEES